MSARQILGWVLVILLLWFIFLNRIPARVSFFGIVVEAPIALVVIFSALMGAGATYLFGRLRKRK